MPFRLGVIRENFSSRLCDSLGPEETLQAAKWLSVARVVLALGCYAWTRFDANPIPRNAWLVRELFVTYVFYSLLMLILLYLHKAADSPYRLTTLAIDLFFAGAITVSTGGPESPFLLLWLFVVVTAAYHWHARETLLTAAVCVLLLSTEALLLRFWPPYFAVAGQPQFWFGKLLMRAGFLLAAGLLAGHIAGRGKELRAESVLLTRVLSQVHVKSGIDNALQEMIGEIAPLYLPLRTSVVLKEGSVEELFLWEAAQSSSSPRIGKVRTVRQFSKLEAEALAVPAPTWHFAGKARWPGFAKRLLALDAAGQEMRHLSSDWQSCLTASEVSPVMVVSFRFEEGRSGRLILVAPSVDGNRKRALRFLQSLVTKVSPAMQNVYTSRDIRKEVGDQVRAGLTRELHDGTIQSLLGAEMQIEIIRRQSLNLSDDAQSRLAAVQSLIHEEVLNLRDLVEKTKPLNFASSELPNFLADLVGRFRRETGINVRITAEQEDPALPPNVCHEVVRIVQESLSNIRKHSGARNVVVTLCDADGHHKLVIAVDGRGFSFRGRVTQPQLDASHRGPSVIKERVRLIGGELTIESFPGQGASLEITIPNESHG